MDANDSKVGLYVALHAVIVVLIVNLNVTKPTLIYKLLEVLLICCLS